MSNPTAMSFCHLKKLLGYLKKAIDYCLVVEFPETGEGYVKKGEAIGAWRHFQIQIGVETRAT